MEQNQKKKKSGFSLVELIIVIAIMVALTAVMAPQFVKYVRKANDAVIISSGEDVLAVAKAEYTAGNLTGTGKIKVKVGSSGTIEITMEDGLAYEDKDNTSNTFADVCGITAEKKCNSKLTYTIDVNGMVFSQPIFEESSEYEGATE